jgi:D-alanine-D-alanine ligase
MKILILTRNIQDYYENSNKEKSEALIREENLFGHGREDIKDALALKKLLDSANETKILLLNDNTYEEVRAEKPDVVFNLCDDGFRGETKLEPHVAAIFDILNIPYTGNNYFTLALCQNKARAKDILTYNDILTPKFQVFTSSERKINPDLKYPLIVKPIQEDGSIGIRERSVVNNEEQLREEVDHIINLHKQEALVEEFIDGREFTVSLIGNRRPTVLPVAEIDFTGMPEHLPRIVSYRAKWVKQSIAYKNTNTICPAGIDEKTKKMIEDTAKKCYKVFGCRGYARIDFRYNEQEKKLYAIEVNPNPDISEDVDTARAALAAGMNYADFIQKIIDFAIERRD